jgi:hypothetical protein
MYVKKKEILVLFADDCIMRGWYDQNSDVARKQRQS